MDATGWFWVLLIVGAVVYLVATAKTTAEELAAVTKSWSLPVVARTYDNNDKGRKLLSEEAAILGQHRYEASLQSGEGGHFRAGTAIATGGLGLLVAGSTHTSGRITLTYKKIGAKARTRESRGDERQRGVWSLPQSSAATLLSQLQNDEPASGAASRPVRRVAGREGGATSVRPATAVRRIHTVIAAHCDAEAEPPWGIRYSIGAGSADAWSHKLTCSSDAFVSRGRRSRGPSAR